MSQTNRDLLASKRPRVQSQGVKGRKESGRNGQRKKKKEPGNSPIMTSERVFCHNEALRTASEHSIWNLYSFCVAISPEFLTAQSKASSKATLMGALSEVHWPQRLAVTSFSLRNVHLLPLILWSPTPSQITSFKLQQHLHHPDLFPSPRKWPNKWWIH